tara:strand:+ start:5963 stop:6835 length:873 start_codon:yes stop_codon:yes gene_type:complete
MKNGCIFLISARKNLLKTCLSCLDKNYNFKFNYPVLIFYHGKKYDDESFRKSIESINPNTKYSFHKLDAKIPEHLTEKDMFWNLPNNKYAKQFEKKREGYLHANYFWNNFMNLKELKDFDYLIRIDDDSWFKNPICFDFFEELDKANCYFGTGFTWNHYADNHLQTRHNLFIWINDYVNRYDVNVKNKQLKESLNGEINNSLFHTLDWNLGNLNIYNIKMFKTDEWKQYNYDFNKLAGGYRYRWGDIEVIGLFAYIHLDNPLLNFDLKKKGLYDVKLPNTKCIHDTDLRI